MMDVMPPLEGSREEVVTRIRNRMEALDAEMADLMRKTLRRNDTELQIRVERAKKSAAEKGSELETVLAQAETADESDWPEARDMLRSTWIEYKEAVDRARLDLERAEELA
ncbi:MAG: hypothetical protein R3304_06055 [Longimicrobiales bacterium]|nr:hypothetical protein [Longimicrobiales bacterium]